MKRTHEQQIESFNEFFMSSETAQSAYLLCESLCKTLKLDAVSVVKDDYLIPLNAVFSTFNDNMIKIASDYFEQHNQIIDSEVSKYYKDINLIKNKYITISISVKDGVGFQHKLENVVEDKYVEQVKNMIELTTFYILAYFIVEICPKEQLNSL